MAQRLASFDNSWYRPGSLVRRVVWYIIEKITINTALPFGRGASVLLRCFGATIGRGVVIKPKVRIKYPWNLSIGHDVWIGEDVWIDNLARVEIGNNVCISQGTYLLCGNHDYSRSTFDLTIGTIVIEDGVWLGAKSIVCPSVRCGSHSILAVASVATRNLEPFGIYQGNPALKIRERKMQDSKDNLAQ